MTRLVTEELTAIGRMINIRGRRKKVMNGFLHFEALLEVLMHLLNQGDNDAATGSKLFTFPVRAALVSTTLKQAIKEQGYDIPP